MALKQELMAESMPSGLAVRLGLDPLVAVTAAGTNQATALDLTGNCWNVSAGTGGVQINSSAQIQYGVNTSGASINVYPPTGQSINGGTVNAAIAVPTGKSIFIIPAGVTLMANVSA